MLVKTLLANDKTVSPILIVCKSNHAVDSFILNLGDSIKNILRLGNRSKNEKMKQYSLDNAKEIFKEKGGKFFTESYKDFLSEMKRAEKKYDDLIELSLDPH